jgi:hypothetical protein
MRSVLMLEVDDESGMIYGDDRDMATHQVVALAGIKDRGQGVVVADVSYSDFAVVQANSTGLFQYPDIPPKGQDRTSSHIRSTRTNR